MLISTKYFEGVNMAIISVNVQDNLKNKFVKICKKSNCNMTSLINYFIENLVNDKKSLYMKEIPNATTIKAIKETEKMVKNEVRYKKYKDFDEFKMEMLKL